MALKMSGREGWKPLPLTHLQYLMASEESLGGEAAWKVARSKVSSGSVFRS